MQTGNHKILPSQITHSEEQDRLDRELLGVCYAFAMNRSTDPSTQNAALFVTATGQVVGLAANHFPDGVKELPERWERPLKYSYVEHAERNLIYLAARKGLATQGLTMYCPWSACTDCARAIIQAGIVEVVSHLNPVPPDEQRFGMPIHPQWKESITVALAMLKEAGVNLRFVEGKISLDDEIKIRFNGSIISP